MWLTNLELSAAQRSSTPLLRQSHNSLSGLAFVSAAQKISGLVQSLVWTYIVPRCIFWKNAVIICVKVTFHWFSAAHNSLNSLKPILPLKSRYSVVKKGILYCIQNINIVLILYLHNIRLLWKLKKNGTKKRSQLDYWKAFFLFI